MNNTQPTIEQLFYDACRAFDESPTEVQGKCRKRNLSTVRCVFCFVAYLYTRYSVKVIGSIMGGRDYTTAINQRDVAIDLLDSKNSDFIKKFDQYKQKSEYFGNMKVIRLPRKFNQ